MVAHFENLMHVLSWTLVHSLWQGLLLALIASAFLVLAKRASSSLRYNGLCTLLFLFVVGAVSTFVWQIGLLTSGDFVPVLREATWQTPNLLPRQLFGTDLYQAAISFINGNAYWIAAGWFCFFCLRSFALFRDFLSLHRLRRYGTAAVPEHWRVRFEVLKGRMGIKRPLLFLESGLAAVPCAIGFLRPMIFVPMGLLAGLPEDQVEAILLHELAHIKRSDFLMNLVQTFVDTLFFFNPAALWLSSVIREERENCCDDLALSVSGDRPAMVRALLSVSEQQRAGALYAAFAGRKFSTLKRAQRILGARTPMVGALEKSILAFSVLCFAIGIATCTANPEVPVRAKAEKRKDLPDDFRAYDEALRRDLISEGIIRDTVGLSYHLSEEDFVVNGKAQPTSMHRRFKSKFLVYKNMTATWHNWKFD